MRPYRSCPLFLCVLVLPLVAGCGGDEDRPGVRLRIVTSTLDGAFDGKLKIQSADERSKVYDVEPFGGEADLFIGPDAPPGRYRVFTDTGWGMLWSGGLGSSVPVLRGPGEPVTPVRIGKPRSIYVAPSDPNIWQLSETWGAEYRPASDPTGPFRKAELEIELDDEGIIALRFDEAAWKHGTIFRVLGQMTTGHVTNLLSYVIKDPVYSDLPRLAMVHGASHAPLRLVLVPPPGAETVADGMKVQVALRNMPFPSAYEEASRNGIVRFDGVAVLGGGLRIAVPDAGRHVVFDLEAEDRRVRGGMHIVALDPKRAVERRYAFADGKIVEAYVRYPGGKAFGRVPLRGGAVVTMPGRQTWLLKTDKGAWWRGVVEDGEEAVEIKDVQRGGTMRGQVRGGGLGYRIDFRPLTKDGPVGGFTAYVSHTSEYTVSLPPGKVQVQVLSPTGLKSTPKTADLRPGTLVRRTLFMR